MASNITAEGVTPSSEIGDAEETMSISNSNVTTSTQSTMKQAVLRVKRRIEDSPSRILVVSFKKRRTEFGFTTANEENTTNDSPSTSSAAGDENDLLSNPRFSKILHLVGTVPGEEADNDNISVTVKSIIAEGSVSGATSTEGNTIPRKNIKARTSKMTEKVREQRRKNTEERRFKIIASKRGMNDCQENKQTDDADLLHLLDLVPESDDIELRKKEKPEGFEPGNVTCNGKPMIKEVCSQEEGFVYDLYLFNDPCIEDFMCGQDLSVEMGDEELDFGEYREMDEDFLQDDDDDSNAEDNYRNDYPDSDDEDGLQEEGYYGATGGDVDSDDGEMYKIFHAMKHGDGSSSDDDLVYGIDADDDGDSFNKTYFSYKSRAMKEYADEVVSLSSDSDYDLPD